MRIALMGYARSGKDTIAKIMEKHLNGTTVDLAFGDALKFHYHELFTVHDGIKARDGYEKFGQAMRDIDPNVWVNALEKEYNTVVDRGFNNIIITDLRQPNEYKWCKENGFTVVKVDAPATIRKVRAMNDSSFNAVNYSEMFIKDLKADYEILNDVNDLKVLENKVITVLGGLKGHEVQKRQGS